MKYVRANRLGRVRWGVLDGDVIRTLKWPPYDGAEYYDGKAWKVADCQLLAPCDPGKIVCVGKNYYDHAVEMGEGIPDRPILFMKTHNCINDPEGEIHAPDFVQRLDYEGELAFVVKKTASRVKAAEAWEYILGFTILNDVTARDVQKADGQWARGKNMDGFAPMGPVVTDEVDPEHLTITTRLNGQVVQQGRTEQLITGVRALISFITASMTLEPGDVIATGTPAGVGPMQPGDTVEVEVSGIGILCNTIV